MKRNVCVVTGTRAEYGLLKFLMKEVQSHPRLNLQIIATGMHLSPEFGMTYREIENDGFVIDRKVEMLTSSDSGAGIAKSMGLGMIGFADALAQLNPDIMVVLGDRFEIFAAVSAALVARIPVAHLHGGEATEGLIDEAFRHSITKMSHLHFVAAQEYCDRVIQLGEQPKNVHLVGGLGVDAIKRMKLLSRSELEQSLGFRFGKKNLLITFHPVTLEKNSAKTQMSILLEALQEMKDTELIFTMPNADTDGRVLMEQLKKFASISDNVHLYTSLGHLRYLSCLQFVDGVIGNSSSGLAEAPTFQKGTINIGDRQKGRLMARSVINCAPNLEDIRHALNTLYSEDFLSDLNDVVNPYGDGGASKKIVEILSATDINGIVNKNFFNINKI
jgi:GDP/UDP-N,N'-diacetylbacillosamine 2-epimerase (hydrolysing)